MQLNQGFVLEDDMVTYTDQQVAIPIFYLEDTYNENDQLDFFEGKENRLIEIHGIEKDNEIYPYELILSTEEVVYEPENPFYLLNGGIENVSFWKNNALLCRSRKT